MVSYGLVVRLKAQSSRIGEVEQFLRGAVSQVQGEPATAAWFALRHGRGEYGIFDAFATEEGRFAHMQGPVAAGLAKHADQLLDKGWMVDTVDVLAEKMPMQPASFDAASALLLNFRAKAGHELKVEQFMRDAQPMVQEEAGTLAWFALRWPENRYGIFAVFADSGARFSHITGRVPRELTRHAFTLLGGMPSMDMLDVMAGHVAPRTTEVGLGVD